MSKENGSNNNQNSMKDSTDFSIFKKDVKPKTNIIKRSNRRDNPQISNPNNPLMNNYNYNNNFNERFIQNEFANIKDNKNNYKIKETEEERKKREAEEKEKNKIRDKLKCFICFGKVKNAMMCKKCSGIACEQCIKKMLEKTNICSNCKNQISKNDMIQLPFMDDLTSFFINNEEQKKETKKGNIDIFKSVIMDNTSKENNKDNKYIRKCSEHLTKKVEYLCLDCNKELCSECLIFLNKENVERHNKHIILSFDDIKEFNLDEIIKEYKNLPEIKAQLDKCLNKYNLNIKEIEIKKKRTNEVLDIIKNNMSSKYSKQISDLENILNKLKNKKMDIENSMNSINQEFNNISKSNDVEQKKNLLEKLKYLNNIPYNEENILGISNFRREICIESYEIENIEFFINDGNYKEELNLMNKELSFIPNTKCRITSQLLAGNIIFTLTITLSEEYYNKYLPKFFGNIIIQSKKSCEYATFSDYSSKNEQILYVEFEFNKMKSLLDENNKCSLKFQITESYYK